MSFPVIDPTSPDKDKLWDQIQVLESILKGAAPGYVTKQWRTEDLERAKQRFKDFDKKADANRDEHGACHPVDVEKVAFTLATYRDMRYSMYGRTAMRAAAMNDKLSMLHRRAVAFDQIDDIEKKE